jgi:hypothetical protein
MIHRTDEQNVTCRNPGDQMGLRSMSKAVGQTKGRI